MYLYSGSSLFYQPSYWLGFAPEWFVRAWENIAPFEFYLRIQGIGEFIIGLLFLAWFGGKWGVKVASILATVEIGLILLLTGVDLITFRDIGLFGAALSLLVISWRENNKTKTQLTN